MHRAGRRLRNRHPALAVTDRHRARGEVSKVHFVISEYEPIETLALLTNDDLDLVLTYDYNLAPASPSPVLETVALWSVP
jgi:hypothetical protein